MADEPSVPIDTVPIASRKRVIWILGGCLAALVALGATLIIAFPAERVGRLAADRASAALDREIGVERIRFRLRPLPAVALEGVTVAGTRGATGDSSAARPLASIRRVELRPRLLPLLGANVRIRSIVIDEPAIVVAVAEAAEPIPEPTRAETAGFWDDATFRIERIRVRGGTVEYRDPATGAVARVEGIDQDLRLDGEVREGELARLSLSGRTSAARIDAELPDRLAVPLRELRVTVVHDVGLDLASERASFDRLAVTLQELMLEGSGTLESWSDPAVRRLSLRLSTGDTELTPLLASLPAGVRSWPANAEAGEQWTATAGRGRVEAVVEGRLGNGELPALDGFLTLDGVALARGREPVVTDLAGRIAFSHEAASTDGLTAQLLGAPLRLAFSLRDPAAPMLEATLSGRLDLARATELGLLAEGWTASGATAIDLVAGGLLTDPSAVEIHGGVTLAGVSVDAPGWPGTLTVSAGALELGGTELVGRGLGAAIGGSDVTLDFALADWLPFALGQPDPAPRLVFESRSRFVDADALFPPDPSRPTYTEMFFARLTGSSIAGGSAAEAAEAAGLKLPELPKIVMDGQIRADRVVQRGGEFQDVSVHLAARDGQLELRRAEFRMLDGGVQLAARLGAAAGTPASPGNAPLTADFRVQDVQADAFLQRFTAFRDNLSGSLQLDGSLTMELDRYLLPEPATLTGRGNLIVLDGRIANWSMVRALGEQLGIARFDTIEFQDWSGRFELFGSRVVLSETTLGSGDLGVRAAGSFDVSGQLDLAGTVYLGPALTGRSTGATAGRLMSAAAGADGRVPVGVHLSGTTRQASIRLDLSEAGSRLADRAREEVEAEARERARDLAGQLVGAERIPPVESPAAALDTVRQRAEDAAVGRLRGLLAPRPPTNVGPPPPPAEADAPPAADTVPVPAFDGGGAAGADSLPS